ncbi:hypothetical protein RND15_50295, partial [Streptomyces sp. DSM 41529]|nr:hypothetical protein [Streptomyces sp. DSM 41529]
IKMSGTERGAGEGDLIESAAPGPFSGPLCRPDLDHLDGAGGPVATIRVVFGRKVLTHTHGDLVLRRVEPGSPAWRFRDVPLSGKRVLGGAESASAVGKLSEYGVAAGFEGAQHGTQPSRWELPGAVPGELDEVERVAGVSQVVGLAGKAVEEMSGDSCS